MGRSLLAGVLLVAACGRYDFDSRPEPHTRVLECGAPARFPIGAKLDTLNAVATPAGFAIVGVDPRIARLVLVAVPVGTFDVSALRDVKQPGFILMAENDEFGTLPEMKRRFPDIEKRFELSEIAGQGHFFDDTTQEVQARVRDYAERVLEVKA